MPIPGVPGGTPTGTKPGHMPGDVAGEKHQVTIGKQTVTNADGASPGGGTVIVGTIPAEQATIPLRGIEVVANVIKGAGDGTIYVNVALDGGSVISNREISSPGATLTVSPTVSQNQSSAHGTLGVGALQGQLHTVNFKVKKNISSQGSTVEVTPTVTVLADN